MSSSHARRRARAALRSAGEAALQRGVSLLWNMDEAQDVVHDAFVRLWRMRRRGDMTTVEPLIYKIALNAAASRRRSKRVWRWVSLDTIRAPFSAALPTDEVLSVREERAQVRHAVEALPEDLRRVIMLCEYSSLSYGEIATTLSIPAGTVGSRRHRALRRLRQALSEGKADA